jgi:hypothetical protein
MLERGDTVERLRATCEGGAYALSRPGQSSLTRGWRAVRRLRPIVRPGALTPPTTRGV